MSVALARDARGAFRQRNYSRLEELIINNRDDRQVAAIYRSYEQEFGAGSFERDLQTFVDNTQGDQAMRTWYRQRFVDRMGHAGILLFGSSAPAPPAVLYTGQAEQIERWRREFLTYFEIPRGQEETDRTVRLAALWALRRWSRLQPQGNLHQFVTTARIQLRNTEIFRASFTILSQRADARQIGISEGRRFFQDFASRIRTEYTALKREAQDYQEVHVARCNPAIQFTEHRGTPLDMTNLWGRLRAWEDLEDRGGPLPVLTNTERQHVRSFRALVTCWSGGPRPGNACTDVGQNAGVVVIGAGP